MPIGGLVPQSFSAAPLAIAAPIWELAVWKIGRTIGQWGQNAGSPANGQAAANKELRQIAGSTSHASGEQ